MKKAYFVKCSNKFLRTIKDTEELFGTPILIAMIFSLLGVICQVYVTLTTFFDYNSFQDWRLTTVIVGVTGAGIISIILMAFTPEMTQQLLRRMQRLSYKLLQVTNDGPNETLIELHNGKLVPFSTAIEKIRDQVNKFEGINVLDFFILRRSLLTSILAHFITYCIVLLQFKVSEK